MKKTFRSISWKIWYTMARTIGILLVLVLLSNITILGNVRNEFIFEQLKESAKAKRNREQPFLQIEETKKPVWVAHFRIEKNKGSFNVTVDQFTQALYKDEKDNEQIINKIVTRIAKDGMNKDKGILRANGVSHYYYVDWDESGNSAIVFLTSSPNRAIFQFETLATMLFLLTISFFASRTAAKRIAKPIQEIKIFAEEVSKRNWNAKAPNTDPDEIGLLAEALEKMRDSLKIAEERDRQFLQSASHDLKTPVMIIKGYAQAILDGINIDSENSAAEEIKVESERLERRITQLLRLNTLEHTLEYYEHREIVRVDRLLKSLVLKFSLIKPELNWKLDLKELEVNGDPEALLIAFENIFENQLRYANNFVKIVMDINDRIEIIISNDGPPFEVKDPMELFNAYKKDKEGKFGLGLAIVKQVIVAHRGTIIANNTQRGVEFKIRFEIVSLN